MRKTCLFLSLATVVTQSSLAFAKEDEFGIEHPSRTDDSNGITRAKGGEYPGAIYSIDAMQLGEVTGASLSHSAAYCLKNGQIEKAIKLSKLSLEKNYDDSDTHLVYAEALEKKYNKQTTKDPALFNKCVQEWLLVLHQAVGDEKGMSKNGVHIPFMEEFYKDEDRVMPARSHIMSLTGYLPKWYETDTKFLKRVGKPVETDVSGVVVAADGKSVKNTQTATTNKQNDKKQISVRNAEIKDDKKTSAAVED